MPYNRKARLKWHAQSKKKAFDGYTNKNSKFYNSSAWRKLRAWYIRNNPACERCLDTGRVVDGKYVDHIQPINQGGAKLDQYNLQTLCTSCNARKTARDRQNK